MRILFVNYYSKIKKNNFLDFFNRFKKTLGPTLKNLIFKPEFLLIQNKTDLEHYVYFSFDGSSSVSNEHISKLNKIDLVIIGKIIKKLLE
jgi:hypothetical protein